MPRPKEFDRDEALDRAMAVFWDRGYEGTSIGDLVERVGIGRQSLYDTFGDKRALYLAALDRYKERFGGLGPAALKADLPVRRSIRALLQGAIDLVLVEPARACMLISAAAERCPEDKDVSQRFCANGAVLEKAFAERLSRAREAGEIASHHDPNALARFFVNALLGLNISAKAGTERAALEQVADITLSVLG